MNDPSSTPGPSPRERARIEEPELVPPPDSTARHVRAGARAAGAQVAGDDELLELLAACDGPEPWDPDLADALASVLSWLLEDLSDRDGSRGAAQ